MSQNTLDITAVRQKIDTRLGILLDQRVTEAQEISPDYADLWEAIRACVLNGGKRLRPYLVFLGYSLAQGDATEPVHSVAVALELLHQSLMIHDDIIDRDLIRHGKENVAGIMRQKYGPLSSDSDHLANSAALLAGDLLISEAYYQISSAAMADSTRAQLISRLHRTIYTVGGGELLDTESILKPVGTENVIQIAQFKTADYSFVTPLLCGAELGEAKPELMKILQQAGMELGVAFQLQDDVLGVFGDSDALGKSTKSDLREGKRTLLVQTTYNNVTTKKRQMLDNLLGDPKLSDEDADVIRGIITESGAREVVKVKIADLSQSALKKLDSITDNSEVRKAVSGLITKLIDRKQ